jgi:hypothetical protein
VTLYLLTSTPSGTIIGRWIILCGFHLQISDWCDKHHLSLSHGGVVPVGSVRATAGALALADRLSDTWIDVKQVNALELLAGRAALSALVSTCTSSLQEMDTMGSRSIWAD